MLDELGGGAREKRSPAHHMSNDCENIVEVYAEDGAHLGSLAWRPHMRQYDAQGGLFICG